MSAPAERRSSPRVGVAGAYLRLLSRAPAQIVDVSPGGALLETSAVAPPGARGRLSTRLKQQRFEAAVQVSHVARPDGRGAGAKVRVGVSFVSMDSESREALARFLGTAGATKS